MRRLSGTSNALALAGSLVLALTLAPASARADEPAPGEVVPAPADSRPDKETCVTSFDRGQKAQTDRALRRALHDLIVCAQESCPAVLRADCAGVLAEVRSALPTIVFAADDGNGHELTDVQVYAGGELLASSLDGHAIPVDPGTVELRFVAPGVAPFQTTRMIREGEKSRVIRVSLGGSHGSAPGASPKRSTLGWVLPGSIAAVGVASLGVALYTRLRFDSRVDDLRGSCAPDCTAQQRDDLSSTLVTSNVAFGTGIGLIAVSVVAWFLTTPPGNAPGGSTSAFVPGGFAW